MESHGEDISGVNLCTFPKLRKWILNLVVQKCDVIPQFVVLAGGKYFARNLVARVFQVVMEPAGSECSQAFALSFKEYGKPRSLIAYSDARL